jgi:hypothetical protein
VRQIQDMFKSLINSYSFIFEVTQSTSKYYGISWNEQRNLWQVEFDINGKKTRAFFEDEFDAVRKLNKFCEQMGMPPQNPGIAETPNQQVSKTFF